MAELWRSQKFLAVDRLRIGNFLDLPQRFLAGVAVWHGCMMVPSNPMGKKLDRRRKKAPSPLSIAARKSGQVITLKRRDALVRQLDTAIWLWFAQHDPISVHLIIMTVYQVLADLGKSTGNGPVARDRIGKLRFLTAYDWLRHASSDPDDYIDFPPRINDQILWDAIISFEKLFGGRTAYMMTFQALFVLWLIPEVPQFREGADAFMPNEITVKEASATQSDRFLGKTCRNVCGRNSPRRMT